MSHALILNASFEPLQIVPWQKAIQLLFQGKVEVVEESDQVVRTVRISIKVPAVLRLLKYIPQTKKTPFVRFSRTNVFLRDRFRCQYCGKTCSKHQLTLDHVIPVSQGGAKSWKNIVTACIECNQRKGGRTPAQAGLKLVREPKHPTSLSGVKLHFGLRVMPEKWKIYLTFTKSYEFSTPSDGKKGKSHSLDPRFLFEDE